MESENDGVESGIGGVESENDGVEIKYERSRQIPSPFMGEG